VKCPLPAHAHNKHTAERKETDESQRGGFLDERPSDTCASSIALALALHFAVRLFFMCATGWRCIAGVVDGRGGFWEMDIDSKSEKTVVVLVLSVRVVVLVEVQGGRGGGRWVHIPGRCNHTD